MSKLGARSLRLIVILSGIVLAPAVWAAHVIPLALNAKPKSTPKVSENQHTRRRMRHLARSRSAKDAHTTGVALTSVSPDAGESFYERAAAQLS